MYLTHYVAAAVKDAQQTFQCLINTLGMNYSAYTSPDGSK